MPVMSWPWCWPTGSIGGQARRGRRDDQATRFALDLAFGAFFPCAQWTVCGFRLLIKQVQAVRSQVITFFDVWAPRMSDPLNGTASALSGYSCVQTKVRTEVPTMGAF
jgi:hypothetical protein